MADDGQLIGSMLTCEEVQSTVRIKGSLETALRTFLGWVPDIPLRFDEVPDGSAVLPDIAIFKSYTPAVTKRLASEGYVHQHRFAVLPSRKKARWLLPPTNKTLAFDGFELYKPFSTSARMMKTLVLLVRSTGWSGWGQDEVLIASRSLLPIERLVSDVTGENQFMFTLSLGTPGVFQKLTVQVMRPDGVILGYLKMPLTDAAGQRLSNEAEFLRKLSRFPQMRSHVPRLLFGGLWNGRNILFESPLEGAVGPTRFTSLHKEFLTRLRDCCPIVLLGQIVVHQTAQRWESVARRMGMKWEELGREALRISERELHGFPVPCGFHHGDFAPWNLREHKGGLLAFDWESATCEEPNLWDQFHFLVQTECLLKVTPETRDDATVRTQNRSLFLLYLLNSTALLIEESAEQLAIDYREDQMLRYISGVSGAVTN
jgi:hypothetical protein